jgi:hypothetical protein
MGMNTDTNTDTDRGQLVRFFAFKDHSGQAGQSVKGDLKGTFKGDRAFFQPCIYQAFQGLRRFLSKITFPIRRDIFFINLLSPHGITTILRFPISHQIQCQNSPGMNLQ